MALLTEDDLLLPFIEPLDFQNMGQLSSLSCYGHFSTVPKLPPYGVDLVVI